MPTQFADLPWLTILIVAPTVVAALIWLVKPLRRAARPIGLATSAGVLIGVALMASAFDVSDAAGVQFTQTHDWIAPLGASYAVGVDGMGLTLVALAALLVPVVLIAGWNEVKLPSGIAAERADNALAYRQAGFVALILVLESLMIAVFAARDLFLFYVIFEAMLIPVYFLIGVYGGPNRRAAALKFLLYSLAGGLVMLAGVIAVYFQTDGGPGTYLLANLTDIAADNPTLQMWLFLSFFIAFAVKAPMFPVHTWLPDAAAQATPGTSTLLVGVLDKVGTFGMIVICLPLFPGAAAAAAPVIIVLAIISIVYGGLVAIGQNDLMRMIAFSSVSHFGFIVMGVFVGTQTALVGAMLYMVAHGVTIAALFLISGFLTQRGASQDMRTYSGMQRVTRVLAGTWLFAGLASLALPGLSGFVPEYLVLLGSFEAHWAYGVFAVIGVVLSALYILLAYQRVFTGPVPEAGAPVELAGAALDVPDRAGLKDLTGREKWAVVPLALAVLFLGLYPAPVLELLSGVADQFAAILGSAS
ncbi:NADH-quinone oxidoreductase subunit M [Occultella kanbiaonis]|uniref:NADH-quinone oxidoreductase subunit M n=1 Tax=Occultella kanbiaonis TaxID=2675754 RepID=UPI0012B89D25|nr:NADH-quinone oxidoreductase subunit M [Occultella kanbiaonis]